MYIDIGTFAFPSANCAKNRFVTDPHIKAASKIACLFLGFSSSKILSKWKRLDWTDRCVGKRAILLKALLPYNGRYKAKISPRLALTEPALQFQKLKAAICKFFIAVMSWWYVDTGKQIHFVLLTSASAIWSNNFFLNFNICVQLSLS